MSRLVVTAFVTLGGGHAGDGGFEHGGWLVPHFDDETGGRIAYWPKVTDPADPIASALNRLPKHVATRTLDTTDWSGTTLLKGDVVAEVRRLKDQPGRELQVHGSADFAQTLIANDLVDEYRLLVFPVVIGTGKRLFAEGAVPAALRLVGSATSKAGITALTYESAGKPEYGTVGGP